MLSQNDVIATIPVSDLGRARKFYEDTLGLYLEGITNDLFATYRTGDTKVIVYETTSPVGGDVVVATWAVEDNIEQLAQELLDKGVVFTDIEIEGFEKKGNIFVSRGFKSTLFKDPDGNRLTLFQIDFA